MAKRNKGEGGVEVRLLVDYRDPETGEIHQANTVPTFDVDTAAALVAAHVADDNHKAIDAGKASSEHKAYLERREAAARKQADGE